MIKSDFSFSDKPRKKAGIPRWLVLFAMLIFILLSISIYHLLTQQDESNDIEHTTEVSFPSKKQIDNKTLITEEDNIYSDNLYYIPLKDRKSDKQTATNKQQITTNTPPVLSKPFKNIDKPEVNIRLIRHIIKTGDNLANLFKKHAISSTVLYHLVNNTKHGKQLRRININQEIQLRIDNKGQFLSLTLIKDKLESISFTYSKDQYHSEIIKKAYEKRPKLISVTITDSLFLSATREGLTDNLTMRIANLFAWDIDFALDIRENDSFTVLYNEHYLNGELIEDGDILAAKFLNQKDTHYAFLYNDDEKYDGYYDENGYSKRKAFLRTPVAFSRISSRFNLKRKHPVLNRIRAHKGVDYAAPRGTPIKTVGDGKVVFKGRKGGYGRVLQIQHGSRYMTVYAHLNSYNKKIRQGSRVKQGQTIAYVGSSGLATGPHLHYEFRVNGVHRNPLTVKLPKTNPLPNKYLPEFKQQSASLIAQLEQHGQ
ncbi:MAG: peptidoglycan DD-metalloendopeptidase family protein [Gammaproteobacteria bacterium]|nr:peptidoglycan DD-metalloendopeptidase family protein [Gammaproteobacteria bacterium]